MMNKDTGFTIWQQSPGLVGIRMGQAFHYVHPMNGQVMRDQLPRGAAWFTAGTVPQNVQLQAQMVKNAMDTVAANYRCYGVKECWWE